MTGYISKVHITTFLYRVEDMSYSRDDISDESFVGIELEIPMNYIREFDKKWIKEGAFLNYYLRMGGITNKQKHVFKFVKRYWTKEDIAECRIRAKEISEIFGW